MAAGRCPYCEQVLPRIYLTVFAGLTVVFAVMGILIFPELDRVTVLIGLLVQLTGLLVVAFLRPVIGSVTVLIMTMTLSWTPTGWQIMYDNQLIIWIPVAASLVSGRVIVESRSRLELIMGLAPLVAWCAVTIGNVGVSPISVLGSISPVLVGICIALVIRLREARKDRLASLEQARLTADRERLLADLHDLITHRITRVVLKSRQLAAGAELTAGAELAPVRDGLAEIERTATETLTALRDYLTAARPIEPTADQGARPVADLRSELTEIVAAERALDRTIRLAEPSGDDRTMINSAIHGCLVRAVREALTNAAKHAAGAPVEIILEARELVRLSVINGAAVAGPDATLHGSGAGAGLRGLASRCHLLGGTMTAEPAGGGFAVRVQLPVLTDRTPAWVGGQGTTA